MEADTDIASLSYRIALPGTNGINRNKRVLEQRVLEQYCIYNIAFTE